MHPITFKDVWGLTFPQLAEVLPRAEHTLRRYGFRRSSPRHLDPPPELCQQVRAIHDEWIAQGRQPIRPGLLNQAPVIAA